MHIPSVWTHALMKKGLRPELFRQWCRRWGLDPRPDEEGIKTFDVAQLLDGFRLDPRPDEEGIKTWMVVFIR